jgi:hypothetical protein
MAPTLGQPGRYVADEAVRKKRMIITIAMVMIAVGGAIEGIIIASYFPPMPFGWLRLVVFILLLVWLIYSSKWAMGKISKLEREQKSYERGAQGENAVARELTRFPNEYRVLHDLQTEFGNLDHVVIGPTGVYVLDAKNNRGIISADGKGGLLQNGKPNEKLNINKCVGRMMGIKEKVLILASTKDFSLQNNAPFFQALFVFTSAWVEPIWGKTGAVNCLTEDQLEKYIVGKNFGTRLKPEQVEAIARAFAQLAHMEIDFTESAKR